MREISAEELLEQFKETVERLAAPAATQVAWLIEKRVPVYELMDEFADSIDTGWITRLREAGLLTATAERYLADLEHALDGLPKDRAFWTDDALRTAAEWQHVRDVASRALTAMAAAP